MPRKPSAKGKINKTGTKMGSRRIFGQQNSHSKAQNELRTNFGKPELFYFSPTLYISSNSHRNEMDHQPVFERRNRKNVSVKMN